MERHIDFELGACGWWVHKSAGEGLLSTAQLSPPGASNQAPLSTRPVLASLCRRIVGVDHE
jgi:hypothetical protein